MKKLFIRYFLAILVICGQRQNSFSQTPLIQQKIEIKALKVSPSQNLISPPSLTPLKAIDLSTSLTKVPQETFVSESKLLGQITGITLGDYVHLNFKDENGKEHSFFCMDRSCDSILEPNKPTFPLYSLLTVHEVQRHIPESGSKEQIKRIENIMPVPISSKNHPCTLYSKLPHQIEGCQGEGCGLLTYHRNIKSIKLYEHPTTSLASTTELPICSELKNYKAFMQIQTLGRVLVMESTPELQSLGVSKGDVVPLINSISEGFVNVCVGNKEMMAYASTGASGSGAVEARVVVINDSIVEDWFQLSFQNKTYWALQSEAGEALMGYYGFSEEHKCAIDKVTP